MDDSDIVKLLITIDKLVKENNDLKNKINQTKKRRNQNVKGKERTQ